MRPRSILASESDRLRMVVAFGLPGHEVPIDDDLNLADLEAAKSHRVIGIVATAVASGHVRADDSVRRKLNEIHRNALRTCLYIEEAAVTVIDTLGEIDVDHRVLKGVALAHLDYANPAERVFTDVDVLIRRRDRDHVLEALTSAGYSREQPPIRNSWERRFGKAIELRSPGGVLLDLHLAITGGYFGFVIDHDVLWDRAPTYFELAGRTMNALDAPGRFLHACCHAVLGGGSGLRALRDVAEIAVASPESVRTAADLASTFGADAVVADAIRTTWSVLCLDAESDVARWAWMHAASVDQARALAGYTTADIDETWSAEGLTTLRALDAIDRVRYLAGLAVPSSSSLRSRGRSRRSHARSLIRSMRAQWST